MRTRRRTLYGRVAVTNRNKKDLFEEEKRSFSTIFLRKNSRDKLFLLSFLLISVMPLYSVKLQINERGLCALSRRVLRAYYNTHFFKLQYFF